MSSSLIKRGLELIDEDFTSKDKKLGDPIQNKKKKNFQKNVKKGKHLSQRKVKDIFKNYEEVSVDRQLENNLKTLEKVDGHFNLCASAEKIKENRIKKLQVKKISESDLKINIKSKGEETVFTEEDFNKMNDLWLSYT